MGIIQTLETDAINEIEALCKFFEADVWPYVKAFLQTLLQQEGKDALQAAVASIPAAATGNVAGAAAAVAAAVAGSLAANAAADAQTEIKAAVANMDANGAATPAS